MSRTYTIPASDRHTWTFSVGDELDLRTVNCSQCGIVYALPAAMIAKAVQLGHSQITWRCPTQGCAENWGYHGDSETEKLERKLQWAREATVRERARAEQAEAEARGQKAAKTRFKNQRDQGRARAAAGVCPCCNRSFKQLRQHLASQHPDYKPSSADA